MLMLNFSFTLLQFFSWKEYFTQTRDESFLSSWRPQRVVMVQSRSRLISSTLV